MKPSAVSAAAPAFRPAFFWLLVAGISVLVVLLSAGAARLFDPKDVPPPLPVIGTIKGDLEAVERGGQTVHFSELRGKVIVCAYLYTVCPHGCAAVTAQMQRLNQMFGSRPDFHLVSVAIQPDQDTPALLRSYAEAVGAKADSPWWFISGEQHRLWDFMTHELGMEPPRPIPVEKRFTPGDLYEHDLRIVLIDRQGRVRRYYAVFHPQPEIAAVICEQLPRDVARVLQNPRS